MTPKPPPRSKVALLFLALAILVGTLGAHRFSRRDLPEKLRQRAERQGLSVKVGRVSHGLVASTMADLEVGFLRLQGISAKVDEVVVRQLPFLTTNIAASRIRFTLSGEPSELFERLAELRKLGAFATRAIIDAEYRHPSFGSVAFEALTTKYRGDELLVRAHRVTVGSKRWDDVSMVIRRRNQMIEAGLGAMVLDETPVQLGYFPSSGGASQWTLTVKHQPARALGRRAGWDPGPAFDATSIVGSLSFIVPDDVTLGVRGSLQLVLDRWPTPDWADAEPLLGTTASMVARIEPTADRSTWNLPDVEISLSIFSLIGVGRIEFGSMQRFAIDASGRRRCAQLEAHLPESDYANTVKRYLEDDTRGKGKITSPPESSSTSAESLDDTRHHDATSHSTAEGIRRSETPAQTRRSEEVALRLQLVANQASNEPPRVVWHLAGGCGLPELTSGGSFTPLELPTFVRKRREHSH